MAIIDSKTGKPYWYEADHGEQRDPFRDWIRNECLPGRNGVVVEDLDLVINCYGSLIGRTHSADGRIKLLEKKINSEMKYAQQRTFELLDKLLRTADLEKKFYRGFYTVKLPMIKKSDLDPEIMRAYRIWERKEVENQKKILNDATFEIKKHPNGITKSMNAKDFIAFLEDRDL